TGAGGEASGAKENATVEVHPDGSATILTGTSPNGQGHQTVWAMLASEELGIPVDRITLKWGDTDLIPEGGGPAGLARPARRGPAARRRRIGGVRGGPRLRRGPQRVRGGRGPGRRGAD